MPILHAIFDTCRTDVKSGTTCYTNQKVSYRDMNPYPPSNRKRYADQQWLACLARMSPYIDRSDARRRSDIVPLATVRSGSRHAPPMQQQLEPRYAYNMYPSTGLMMDWQAGGDATERVAAALKLCTCIRQIPSSNRGKYLRFPVVFLRPSRLMLTNIWSHDCFLHKHHKLIVQKSVHHSTVQSTSILIKLSNIKPKRM
jgi:hypothetical protein